MVPSPGGVCLSEDPIHVADLQVETKDYPEGSAIARELGHRTILVVPLLREGVPLGAISLRRNKAEPFTEKQIELVETFADQAVIAIENTRLFEEVEARTRELRQFARIPDCDQRRARRHLALADQMSSQCST